MSNPVVESRVGVVSGAIYDWLEAEYLTSSAPGNINNYLDDHERAVDGLRGGFEHRDNFAWNKLSGHLNRLSTWLEAFSLTTLGDKDFDQQAAKLSFAGLMQVSGSYRDQCYIEAKNQEDYNTRRRQVIGISIADTVSSRLTDLIPPDGNFSDARISIESLDEERKEVSDIGESAVKTLCSRATLGLDLGEPGSRSAMEMIWAQHNWLDFTVDSLILVAKYKRGDLSAVPFREPRSDNEQSGVLQYPLREHVDWAEVLAD